MEIWNYYVALKVTCSGILKVSNMYNCEDKLIEMCRIQNLQSRNRGSGSIWTYVMPVWEFERAKEFFPTYDDNLDISSFKLHEAILHGYKIPDDDEKPWTYK